MSQKRGKKHQPQAKAKAKAPAVQASETAADTEASMALGVDAAPDAEILAEGSGPVDGSEGVVVRVGMDPIAGADVEELASAASTIGLEAVARHAKTADADADGDASPADVAVELAGGEGVGDLGGDPEVVGTDPLEEISDDEAAELGAALPTSAASMDPQQLEHLVEALVFASDKPITIQRLRQLTRVSDVRRLEQALADLAANYSERGIVLQQVSGGYQFRTRTQFSSWVQQLIAGRPVRLSRAQLETLAIVAYRQPITRPEIDEIRGVDSSATLKLLLDRSLIRILGKKEEVGRPMLYGTTKEFLDFFSLGDLRELPTLREYSELTDESRRVMTDRLGIDPDPSEEPLDPESDDAEPPEPSIDEMIASYSASMDESATTTDDSSPTVPGAIDAAIDQAADAEAADLEARLATGSTPNLPVASDDGNDVDAPTDVRVRHADAASAGDAAITGATAIDVTAADAVATDAPTEEEATDAPATEVTDASLDELASRRLARTDARREVAAAVDVDVGVEDGDERSDEAAATKDEPSPE